MSSPHFVERIQECISAHDWSADKSRVALCPNSNLIVIYKRSGDKYEEEHVLAEHDAVVTSINWGKTTNRILTCSQDRNAYVWTLTDGFWKPVLVILRLNRAATLCSWSPREDKFAVSSGAQCLSVCYFEQDNNWWVSKHIKKEFTSTLLCVDWHPNNILLASGGTDMTVRVHSGFIKTIDKREEVSGGTAFGKKLPFGQFLAEFKMDAWVLAIKWSPSGNRLAWFCQNSSIHILDCATAEHRVTSVNFTLLPVRDFVWLNEDTIVGGGYDCNILLFQNAGSWKFVKTLDNKKETKATGGNARSFFQNKSTMGSETATDDQALPTRHQNAISVVKRLDANTLSTTGLDGNIVVWDLRKLSQEEGFSY
jgi:actin related protein 2/3 complex subunit 1A/1B